jgi:hypothetical protein
MFRIRDNQNGRSNGCSYINREATEYHYSSTFIYSLDFMFILKILGPYVGTSTYSIHI